MTVQQPPITMVAIPAVNKWVGKRQQIVALVNHVAECDTLQQLDNWFADPSNQQGSSNYGIGPDGTIHCYVDPFGHDAPFANGILNGPDSSVQMLVAGRPGVNPNYWTVSVEHVGWSSFPTKPFVPTTAQLHSSAWLAAWLAEQQGWSTDEDHLLGHYEFDRVTRAACPGWSRTTWLAYEAIIATFQQAQPTDPLRQKILDQLVPVDLALQQLTADVNSIRALVSAPAAELVTQTFANFETSGRRGNE